MAEQKKPEENDVTDGLLHEFGVIKNMVARHERVGGGLTAEQIDLMNKVGNLPPDKFPPQAASLLIKLQAGQPIGEREEAYLRKLVDNK